MNKDLFFIRLISEAVSQPNAGPAIRQAIKKIIHLGQAPEYEKGYSQFQLFMQKVFETTVSEVPWLFGIWENHTKPAVIKINVIRNDKLIASLPLELSNIPQRIPDAVAGYYIFQLNTGRILWMHELTEKDLILLKAFPDSDLRLAATTEDLKPKPSKQIKLLGGEIVIRILPGFESGCIEVLRLI
jgi:hypothetical protein